MKRIFILFCILLIFPAFSNAQKIDQAAIPEDLKLWRDWVMYGHEDETLCVPAFNNSSIYFCAWPGKLILNLKNSTGTFEQKWDVNRDQFIPLPGDRTYWPEEVMINGKRAGVVERDSTPSLFVTKGSHRVTGKFTWRGIPEYLQAPAKSALIDVTINGGKVNHIDLNQKGRLWLKSKTVKSEKIEDQISVQAFRKIDDRIPPKVDIKINIQVSGSAREISLGKIYSPDEFIPLSIDSKLPARLEETGVLRVQAKPGSWTIDVTIRKKGEMNSLSFQFPENEWWPKSEVWVFRHQPALRVVKVNGVPIDPKQTTLPSSWINLPAYLVHSNEKITLDTIKRGEPSPAPDQLSLQRTLWLNFDNSGYTVHDKISGSKNNQWRVEAQDSRLKIGRVVIDGKEQFITLRDEKSLPGVEMRRGTVNMEIDSTIAGTSQLPATGYDTDFQKVNISLNLPPGFRLLNVTGVDNVYRTWIKSWNLLNLFIVLITTLTAFKLFGRNISLLTFFTMVLIYHEPHNPPILSWLNLFAAISLLKVVPEGKAKKFLSLYRNLALVSVALIAIPFMIIQIRTSIYPQLEKGSSFQPIASKKVFTQPGEMPGSVAEDAAQFRDKADELMPEHKEGGFAPTSPVKRYSYRKQAQLIQQDPTSIIQTGPGLPTWHWTKVNMSWTGPVTSDQKIKLMIVHPKANLLLSFLKVILLFLLFLSVMGIGFKKGKSGAISSFTALSTVFFFLFFLMPSDGKAGEIPSPDILKELEKRLLEKDDCFPKCADLQVMSIKASELHLAITLDVNVIANSSIPLPGFLKQWRPDKVVLYKADGSKREPPLLRQGENLWVSLSEGSHKIELTARIPESLSTVQINTPLNPHHVKHDLSGWSIEGLDQYDKMSGVIHLKRINKDESTRKQDILESGILPPFFIVERTLRLGLRWQAETVIKRISPPGSSATFKIPLLPGEALITERIEVQKGYALINFQPNSSSFSWSSTIEMEPKIVLEHQKTNKWTELWKVEASAIWRLQYDGIPVIHHKQGDRWYPQWHPWPGETVTLSITKPQGVEGKTKTIIASQLETRPGRTSSDHKLSFTLRSSQGGQHTVSLPNDVAIQRVDINGGNYPIQRDDKGIILPINPGAQSITIEWRDQNSMGISYKTPTIDLGDDSVNANIKVYLGSDRWPLFLFGPKLLAPAVRYWSFCIVLLLLAFALSKIPFVPLKFHQWFLLGLGLSQAHIGAAALIVAWLIALGGRGKIKPHMAKGRFNFMQICLVILTVLALITMVGAISQGLLGQPNMQVAGNKSSNYVLNWYADRTNTFPTASIISLPMWTYRLLMLLWALWISFTLMRLLRWGWDSFSSHHLWRKIERKQPKH